MHFGISHKGHVYTVTQDSVWEIFRVSLDIETYWLSDPSDSESWEELKTTIQVGSIDMRNAHFYGWFECRTRWNGERMSFDADTYGINDAVAFIADNFKPCKHEISASQKSGSLWECEECGKDFTCPE